MALAALRTALVRVPAACGPMAARALATTQYPYLCHNDKTRKEMLDVIGAKSVDELFADIPEKVRLTKPLDLPGPKSEIEILKEMNRMANKNTPADKTAFFIGGGFYRHHIPTVVDHLIQRSEFLTAYTPYQPEVSQGTLQILFEFQTQVAMLTGMDLANASMYDGPTAVGEAVFMSRRIKNKRKKVVLSGGLHPHSAGVVDTLLKAYDNGTKNHHYLPANHKNDEDILKHVDETTACVVVQNPDVFGRVRDLKPLADEVHKRGALLVATFGEVFSLGMLKSPGAMGADIVVGEGQGLGNALNYGGPSVGLMATKQAYMRQIPGRLIGQTIDAEGNRCWALALGTREQHIRREKATSNICTSAGVCATAFSMHLTTLGEAGFTQIAKYNHYMATQLVEKIKKECTKIKVLNETYFNEISLVLPKDAETVVEKLAKQNIMAGVPASRLFGHKENGLGNVLITAVTELTTKEDIDTLVAGLKKI